MTLRSCPNCGYPFKGRDKIRAVVLSEWIDLKSTVSIAIGKPTDCLEVEHRNCNFPQGMPDGD